MAATPFPPGANATSSSRLVVTRSGCPGDVAMIFAAGAPCSMRSWFAASNVASNRPAVMTVRCAAVDCVDAGDPPAFPTEGNPASAIVNCPGPVVQAFSNRRPFCTSTSTCCAFSSKPCAAGLLRLDPGLLDPGLLDPGLLDPGRPRPGPVAGEIDPPLPTAPACRNTTSCTARTCRTVLFGPKSASTRP